MFEHLCMSQNIGINTTGASADTSAGLDIDFTNKSLLIPNVTLTGPYDAVTISRPAAGLLVYNTGTGGFPSGFLHNLGTQIAPRWIDVSNSWSVTGNTGTIYGTNFIGTTDSVSLDIKVNNIKAGRIDPNGVVFIGYKAGFNHNNFADVGIGFKALYSSRWSAQVAIGYASLACNISLATDPGWDEYANVAIGYRALNCNARRKSTAVGANAGTNSTTGNYNTAVGAEAMKTGTISFYNTSIGYMSLYSNLSGTGNNASGPFSLYSTTGSNNTGKGFKSLYWNTTGSNNVAVGDSSMITNTTGTLNTCIGKGADVTSNNLTKATAIGYKAKVACSNCLVLGGTGNDAVNVGVGVTAPLNTLTVAGSIAGKYRAGNTITMAATDLFIKLTAAGASTLPLANSVKSGTIVIITNTTAAAITLNRAGADTMCNNGFACGSTSVSIAAYTAVSYVSDGTSVWYGW